LKKTEIPGGERFSTPVQIIQEREKNEKTDHG